MNESTKKLADILSNPSFYEENKDLSDHGRIITAIKSKIPDVTEAEIDKFLCLISEVVQSGNSELSAEDLEEVAGGFAITITVAGVITAVKVAAAAGTAIGAAIWYYKNRKK